MTGCAVRRGSAPYRSSVTPRLLYLYGPPAAGKLTIAEKVQARSGFRLFHNHLTVNAVREVFEFNSVPFVELVHRIRLDVFATAMRHHVDLIFTNNSAWSGPNPRARFAAFATQARMVVEQAGGRCVFVQVTAPLAVLEARVAADSRRSYGKLLDPVRLRELILEMDDAPLTPDDLRIDTSVVAPDVAASLIVKALAGNRRE